MNRKGQNNIALPSAVDAFYRASSARGWLLLAVLCPFLASGQGWYSTGGTWTDRKPVTVSHTMVSGGASLSSFAVLVSVTDVYLKTVANGGYVGQSNGNDILFTASDGVTKLNHEIETYNGSTGQLIAWVNVPTLSASADTSLYLYYGNASASNQQNPTAVWDSNYAAVYHLPNGSTLTENDSTSNHSNATTTQASAGAGEIGGGAVYAGTQQDVIPAFTSTAFPYSNTLSMWVNLTSSEKTGWADAVSSTGGSQGILIKQVFGLNYINVYNSNGNYLSTESISAGWHYLVVTNNGSSGGGTLYIDGSPDSGGTFMGGHFQSIVHIGKDSDGGISGTVDEIRFSQIFRSAAWIATEYYNQSAPGTYVTLGSQQSGSQVAAPTFSPVAGTYSSTQTVTISTTTSGAAINYTTDTSTPTETHGTPYTVPVSVSSSETLKAMAYESGWTDSTVSSAAYTITGSGNWYSTGGTWTDRKPVTVSHTMVSGGASLSSFAVLVSVTDVYLKTVANGGYVGQSNGNDILFTASDGVTKLNHEIETYNGSTGQLIAWVNVPTLSASADTSLYLYYGNASASNQQNPTAVWDSNYAAVYHLPNGSTLTENDSTSNHSNATTTQASAGAGEIGGGAVYAGTQQDVIPAFTSTAFPYSNTLSMWVNLTSSEKTGWADAVSSTGGSQGILIKQVFGLNYINVYNSNGNYLSTESISAGWHYLVVTNNGSSGGGTLYIDGSPDSGGTFMGGHFQSIVHIGKDSDGGISGTVDEIRFSQIFRSAAWIATEYYNQSAPGTYVTLGSQQSGSQVAAPTFSPVAGTYSSTQTVTISTTTSGAAINYTTDTSTPTETHGTPYTVPVSVSSSETLKAMAYESGWTDSTVSSAAYTITGSGTVTVTVTSAPSGLSMAVDSSNCTAPCTFQWTPGSNHVINVSSPQSGGTGTQYLYGSWSDSGAQSHQITVPSSATTYTATFTTQYYLTTSATAGGSISPASTWENSGAVVPVTATANAGYTFSGFSGSLNQTSSPQNLTMNAAASVTANFSSTSGSTLATTYTYDIFNNLTGVTMIRDGNTQTRTFVYNGTNLQSATNPENGTVSYTYNQYNKIATKTDAKGQVVAFNYDSLARLTQIQRYPQGRSNPEDTCQRETYSYDTNPYSSTFSQNTSGRLAAVVYYGGYNPSGTNCISNPNTTFTEMYSYKPVKLVVAKQLQVTRGSSTAILEADYGYDSEGRMISEQYPASGLPSSPSPNLQFTYDTMSRPLTAKDNTSGTTLISGATYGPSNELLSISGQITESRSYNSMLQLTSLVSSNTSGTSVNLTYAYSSNQNNSKITSMTDNISGEQVVYTYDALNRLATAAATNNSWGQSYSYDGFGNLTDQTETAGSVPQLHVAYNYQTNRQTTDCADLNGNINSAAGGCGTTSYNYDVSNRVVSLASTSPSWQYSYAPHNKRVWRGVWTSGTLTTDEVTFWGANGQKLGTWVLSTSGSQLLATMSTSEYYFGKRLIKNNTGYLAKDKLGSVGKFYPWGQEKPSSTTNGTEKFTGYYRDSETGNDYAINRYHQPGMGRFLTPDPYSKSANGSIPGSWNRYSYVTGDPVNSKDPKGLFENAAGCDPGEDAGCIPDNGGGGVTCPDSGTLGYLEQASGECDYVPPPQSPSSEPTLQCGFSGGLSIPDAYWGVTQGSVGTPSYGFWVPIHLSFLASGGTGTYTWSINQQFSPSGLGIYEGGVIVSYNFAPEDESLDNISDNPTGNVAVFYDSPGILDPGTDGLVESAYMLANFVDQVTVTSGNQTIQCPLVSWSMTASIYGNQGSGKSTVNTSPTRGLQ